MFIIVLKLIIIESLQLITIGRIDGLLRQFAEQIHWRPKGLKGQHQMTYHLQLYTDNDGSGNGVVIIADSVSAPNPKEHTCILNIAS